MVNGFLEFSDTEECPSADHSSGDQGEESLDLIEPGTAGWGEVEVESLALLWFKPPLYLGAFVGAVVVHDQVNIHLGWQLIFQMGKKSDELATAMTGLTGADHLAVENIESGK